MNKQTLKQILFPIPIGIISSEVWVYLFGYWAIHDTPLIKSVWSISSSGALGVQISISLFALLTGVLFAAIVCRLFKSSIVISAVIFIASFFCQFIVALIKGNIELSFFTNDLMFPIFIVSFTAYALLFSKLRRA